MFEHITYEGILQRMLDKVPNTVDKREGSMIYDALAPAAVELQLMYINMDNALNESFIDTNHGQYLDRKAAEIGLERKKAILAIRKGTFNIEIPIGSRFSIEDVNFRVIERMGDTTYRLECETVGEIGNRYSGEMIPIDYIPGLISAVLTDILLSGEEAETDDNLRTRFYNRVQMPATSGNAFHYKQWALEVEGIGDCKIISLWNGPGTVKVIIVDSDKSIDSTLEPRVLDHIETVRPIGAAVTVRSPTAKNIAITANAILDSSVFLGNVQQAFADKIMTYFKSIIFKSSVVSYAIIGSLLLDVAGVSDYSDLRLNGEASNIVITNEEIPVLGSVLLEVI